MHTLQKVCIVYSEYAWAVYNDEIKSVVPADISTLSTWLSTVLHGKRLYKPPSSVNACGKPGTSAAFSTCGDTLTYFLPGYYKACPAIQHLFTIPLKKSKI
jgi:hypothetical protein